jgi:hypothetical protein
MREYLTVGFTIYAWVSSLGIPLLCALHTIYARNLYALATYAVYEISFKTCIDLFFTQEIHNNIFYKDLCKLYYSPMENHTLVKTTAPKQSKMIASFPHGLFCGGFNIAGGCRSGTSFTALVASVIVNIPCFGDWLKVIGFQTISKSNMQRLMNNKENIIIVAGGFNEIFMMRKYEYNIFIPSGFIAMAIKQEYTIIPLLSLGENETFSVITPPKFTWRWLQSMMRVFPVPIIFPYAGHRIPVIPIYGDGIECKPTDDVEEIRQQLKKSLEDIFKNNIEEYCRYRNDLKIKPEVNSAMYSINFYS